MYEFASGYLFHPRARGVGCGMATGEHEVISLAGLHPESIQFDQPLICEIRLRADFARLIGADGYGENAPEAVQLIKQIVAGAADTDLDFAASA